MRNDFTSSFILFLNNSKTNFDEPFSSFDVKNMYPKLDNLKRKETRFAASAKRVFTLWNRITLIIKLFNQQWTNWLHKKRQSVVAAVVEEEKKLIAFYLNKKKWAKIKVISLKTVNESASNTSIHIVCSKKSCFSTMTITIVVVFAA